MSLIALIDGDMLVDANGYKRTTGDRYEHRVIVETVLGRSLQGTECVHHVDRNRSNNISTNLVVCPDQKYHLLLHARQKVVDLKGDPNTDKYCSYHMCLHNQGEFSTSPSNYDNLHNNCRTATNEYRKIKGYKTAWGWRGRMHQQSRRAVKSGKASKL
tara:strand:- start:4635 stop:5108 length:474 start_codon:yes stop_codon:yes gene_type:complete